MRMEAAAAVAKARKTVNHELPAEQNPIWIERFLQFSRIARALDCRLPKMLNPPLWCFEYVCSISVLLENASTSLRTNSQESLIMPKRARARQTIAINQHDFRFQPFSRINDNDGDGDGDWMQSSPSSLVDKRKPEEKNHHAIAPTNYHRDKRGHAKHARKFRWVYFRFTTVLYLSLLGETEAPRARKQNIFSPLNFSSGTRSGFNRSIKYEKTRASFEYTSRVIRATLSHAIALYIFLQRRLRRWRTMKNKKPHDDADMKASVHKARSKCIHLS